MTAFCGFGAIPSRQHGSPFAWARSPRVPLCIARSSRVAAPCIRTLGRPGDVGPGGRPPFLGRIFRARVQPGIDWSRSASLVLRVTAHHARVR